MARYFIRKTKEEIFREEIKQEIARQSDRQIETLQSLLKHQNEEEVERERKRHLVRGSNGKFVPKEPEILKAEPEEVEHVYISRAEFGGDVSLKSVSTVSSDMDDSALQKAKEKKK